MDTTQFVAGRSPAEIYDEEFVPALFRPFAGSVADAAGIRTGQKVLDVACGTGVLTLAAAERVGPTGAAVGLDANPDMLTVARRKAAPIEWIDGRAEALPFADTSFDAVVSQFGLKFFDDRIADAFQAPFAIGDAAFLATLCRQAGLARAEVVSRSATVSFPSIDALVSTERACVWTLGGLLDDAQFERLVDEARCALRPFVQRDGRVAFEMPALLIVAGKT